MHKICHLQVVIAALATFLVRAAYWYFASNGNSKSLVLKGKNIFRKERENMRMFYRGQCYCFGMQCNQTQEELLPLSIRIMRSYCLLNSCLPFSNTHPIHTSKQIRAHLHTHNANTHRLILTLC